MPVFLLLQYSLYDLKDMLTVGENVIGILLGNGFLNNIGGQVWDFDTEPYRSAPKMAFALETENGVLFEADESVKTHPSAILFDDFREGEWYDARLEVSDWTEAGFDDSAWEKRNSRRYAQGRAQRFFRARAQNGKRTFA